MKTHLLIFSLAALSGSSACAATFTSIASGSYSAASTWSFSGVDADGIPDNDDDVTISGGTTVTLTSSSNARDLVIDATGALGMNNFAMLNWGDLTNNGTISGAGPWQFRANGTFTGNPLNYNGSIYFYSSYTIATSFAKTDGAIILSSGVTVTNNGNVSLLNSGNGYISFGSTTSRWINAANSNLSVSVSFSGSNGILTASAVPNTVTYRSNSTTTIKCANATYYNLTLISATSSTKALNGNLTVANNLIINAGTTLNSNSQNITIGGNWTNNANTNCQNMATTTFNGSTTQTISRSSGTEVFNHLTYSGTATLQLARAIRTTGNLSISSGVFDVSASNFGVTVAGNFTNNGTFTARQGIVTFNGTLAQTVGGSSPTAFYNITASNGSGVNITIATTLENRLTVTAGSFNTSGAGTITLLATGPTTSARIGNVASGATLGGTGWILQTYIDGPATAYWQYLSSSVNGMTLNDWDQDPRFYMSGVGGNDGTACCPTFFSVRTYNEPTNTYTNITTINHVLSTGLGYLIWMGDNTTQLTAPLVFDSRGTPYFGNATRAVTAGGSGGGYNLVGNPYACPIDYASVVSASSATLNADFLVLQENGSYATSPNGGVIAANQGFLAVATTSGNVNFTETCKNTSANPNIIRTGSQENVLYINSSNVVNGLGGQAVVRINDDATDGFEPIYDLPFIASPYDDATNIWTSASNGQQLLLNATDAREDELSIPLSVLSGSPGDQLLSFRGLNNFSSYTCAWLEDLSTGEKIDLRSKDTYTFFAENIGEERKFMLHFGRTASECPLSEQAIVPSLDAMSQVFVNNGNILVKFSFEENTEVEVTVYNTAGQEVSAPVNVTVAAETISLESPGAHGIYFVRIVKGDEMVTKKIYY